MEFEGRKLHRIEALIDFGDVEAGDKGGWIEKESNLSHQGSCWVYDEAKVYDVAAIVGSLGGYYLTSRVIDIRSEANSATKETNSFSIAPTLIPHKNKILPGVNLSMTFD